MSNLSRAVQTVETLNVSSYSFGQTFHLAVEMTSNALGFMEYLPVVVVRGAQPGPVVGFTAAVHGNELNGVRVIHKLLRDLEADIEQLRGTVVAVPVVNINGYLNSRRHFSDGVDLNRIMPGIADGNSSAQYAARFVDKIVRSFDYLIDLHTASFGRVNSFYVRADLQNEKAKQLAFLQHPQIVVHNVGRDGSLRGAATKMGIPAITVEVGDPQKFQKRMIRYSLVGIHNILSALDMLPLEEEDRTDEPLVCERSFWIYTDRGGIIEVFPEVAQKVEKDEVIARLSDVYGQKIKEYTCPEAGVVIGKSVNPVSPSGGRILHLGLLKS